MTLSLFRKKRRFFSEISLFFIQKSALSAKYAGGFSLPNQTVTPKLTKK
jgi:hypothetical protein